MRSRRLMTVCFFSLAALALASCGSSKKSTSTSTTPTVHATLTKAQVIKQGDAICTKARATTANLKAPSGNLASPPSSQLKAVGTYLNSLGANLRTQFADLQALGEPKTDATAFNKAVAAGYALAGADVAAGQAALIGNPKAYKATYAKVTAAQGKASSATKAFGFTVCGQAP